MSPILPLFAAVLATLPYVHGYGRGAPDTTCGVASSMLPGHGSQRQPSSTNPYTLSTANNQSTYTAGDVITLTLNGGATPFSGFLVQAISVNGGIVGTMIAPPGSKVLFCGGKGDDGLTHSTKTPKSSFAFQWKAPDPVIAGDITFLVTVVQRYSTYWVNQPMLTIRPVQNAQPRILPQAQTPVTVSTQGPTPLRAKLQTPNGQIQYNMECGVSKGCFVDCSSNTDCAYMVTWKDLGSAVQFEVYGKQDPSFTEAWVAVGFSSDLHMGDDSVTECVSSNGLIKAFNSHNPDAFNMRLTDPPLGLSNVAGYYSNGVFACIFTREKNVPQDPKIFDLEKDWHLMYANGKSSRAWQLDIHSLTNRPPVTSAKMDFQARVVTGNAPQAPGTPQAQTTLVSSIDTTTLTSQPPTQVTTNMLSNMLTVTRNALVPETASVDISETIPTTSSGGDFSALDFLFSNYNSSVSSVLDLAALGDMSTASVLDAFNAATNESQSSNFTPAHADGNKTEHSEFNLKQKDNFVNKFTPRLVSDLTVTEMPLSNPDIIFSTIKRIVQTKEPDFRHNIFLSQNNESSETKRTSETFYGSGPLKSAIPTLFQSSSSSSPEIDRTEDRTTLTTNFNNNKNETSRLSETTEFFPKSPVTGNVDPRTRHHVHDVPDPVPPDTSVLKALDKSRNLNRPGNQRPSEIPYFSVEGGKIQYDPECGSTKGCFVDCKGGDCKYMVTWKDLGSSIQFELYGKPDRSFTDAWVAVGFSDDTRMGGDSVTECVYSNGVVQAFSSYNTGYSNRRLDNPQFGLSNVAGIYYDGVLSCTFIRRKFVPQDPKMYNLEDDWHIMFANGRVLQVPAWELYMHSITELPPTSAARVDFQSTVVIGSGAKFPLVKAHGCLMILAWVLFTGVGIVAARYYKNVWADKTFLKLKIWFQVHRACMISALVFDVVAFIIIFIEVQGYSSIPDVPGKGYLRSHPILGIIITILCIANPAMALFRPGPDHDKRPIFNWAHWGVGMSAYILSAICICFGFQLGKSSTPDYAIYIMIVYVLYIIIFDVVFEVMEFMSKKQKKVKVDGMEMSSTNGTDNGNIPNGNHVTKETIRKTDKVKTMLLAIHVAFTGAFALVLVLVVALN